MFEWLNHKCMCVMPCCLAPAFHWGPTQNVVFWPAWCCFQSMSILRVHYVHVWNLQRRQSDNPGLLLMIWMESHMHLYIQSGMYKRLVFYYERTYLVFYHRGTEKHRQVVKDSNIHVTCFICVCLCSTALYFNNMLCLSCVSILW